MPNDPATVVYNLIQKDPSIIAAAVIQGSNNILYSTDNWDISSEVGKVISSWNSLNAQFVILSGVKYSVLQCTSERLVATSIRGEGHVIGAKDDEHKILIYLEPDGEPMGATMDTSRAVSELSSKQNYIDPNSQIGSAGGSVKPSGGANINPQLKGEVQSFLEWIKDSEGLSGYINYYLQQNNTSIISELSKIYSELRQIFGV